MTTKDGMPTYYSKSPCPSAKLPKLNGRKQEEDRQTVDQIIMDYKEGPKSKIHSTTPSCGMDRKIVAASEQAQLGRHVLDSLVKKV